MDEAVTERIDAVRLAARRLEVAAQAFVEAARATRRASIPIERLREAGADRVRWGALRDARIATLADLDGIRHQRLCVLPGIGVASAEKIGAAARLLRASIAAEPTPCPEPGSSSSQDQALAQTALAAVLVDDRLAEPCAALRLSHVDIGRRAAAARRSMTFFHWLVTALWAGGDTAPMAQARVVTQEMRELLEGELFAAVDREFGELLPSGGRWIPPAELALQFTERRDEILDRIAAAIAPARLDRSEQRAPTAMQVREATAWTPEPAEADSASAVPSQRATRGGPTTVNAKLNSSRTLTADEVSKIGAAITGREQARSGALPDGTTWFIEFPPGSVSDSTARGMQVTGDEPASQGREDMTAARAARWVPPGESYSVHRFEVPGGMVYLGRSADRFDADPCLIDAALPVALARPDRAGEAMTYWPSYSTISPECRAAYLEWLVGGRRDPEAYIGYVFLFFYGLERRLLRERDQCADAEVAAILAEIERLLGLYSGSHSFRGYAGSLLTTVRATLGSPRVYKSPPPAFGHSAYSTELLVALGQAAQDRAPIPAAWALAWHVADAGVRLGRAAIRCPDEFDQLFAIRYAREFGDGWIIVPEGVELTVSYRPASAAFDGQALVVATGLPTVRMSADVRRRLAAVVDSCAADLDAVARGRTNRPGASTSLAEVALLPPELVATRDDGRLNSLRSWLDEVVPRDAPHLLLARELFSRWVEPAPTRLTPKDVTQLAVVLGRLGFAMDPDPRFGGGAILASDVVALLRVPPGASSAPSGQYPAAALIIRLCTAVACAEERSTRGELARVEEIARAMDGVEETERLRLRACAVRLFETKATLGSIAKHVASFPQASRERLGRLLVGVAAVDGRLSAPEIALLTRVFTALGLDPAAVYREAHARATDTVPAEEPVVVRQPQTSRAPSEYAIPPIAAPTRPAAPGVRIDERVLARKQAETAEVLAMLAPIFAEEAPSALSAAPAPPASSTSELAGLDAKHAAFVRRLGERASWSRADLEGVCEDLGLLADGALEVVNDAAFDRVGGPVVEGEDPLDVDVEAIRSWTT